MDLGPAQVIQDDLISRSLITSGRTLFPNKVTSQVPGACIWEGGDTIPPGTPSAMENKDHLGWTHSLLIWIE